MRPHKLLLALFACPALLVAQTPDTARMAQVVDSFNANKTFMGTVLVAKDDNVLLNNAYGYADLEWSTPNTPDTKFRLGSLTKQFTAASILLLVEQGKVALDAPIKTYYAEAPASWDAVTIRALLSHTAGIPNFTNFADYHNTQRLPTTPAQLIARFRDKPLDFAPGTDMRYSNSGYELLGYVIEKASGVSYKEFVTTHFFTPLDMTSTGYDDASSILPKRAHGYTPSKTGIANADYIDMSIPFAAGGLYSTTGDLLKWERGLFSGKVLKPESLTAMTTPLKHDYAFGLSSKTVNGHKVIFHNGGIDGFNTRMSYYPDDHLTVIVLTNLNGNAADEIASDLGTLAFGGKITLATEHKEVAVSPELLAEYVGTYSLAPNFDIAITLEDGHLIGQATGQPKIALFAESDVKFFTKLANIQIQFNREAGKVNSLTLFQNGEHIARRK